MKKILLLVLALTTVVLAQNKLYKNAKLGFQLEYPSGWTTQEKTSGTTTTVVFASAAGTSRLDVICTTVDNTSASEMLDATLKNLEYENVATEDQAFVSEAELDYYMVETGKRAFFTPVEEDIQLTIDLLILQRTNRIYALNCTCAPDQSDACGVLPMIVHSFRALK